jgi:DNA-binding transcriptional ArsR family regulator
MALVDLARSIQMLIDNANVDPVAAFEALAHETRLEELRLQIPAGPEGLAAGAISERVGRPPNALSFHLARLAQADLVTARRAGRQIFYAARYERLTALLRFLVEDCCAAAPAGCLPGCPSTLLPRSRDRRRHGSDHQRR